MDLPCYTAFFLSIHFPRTILYLVSTIEKSGRRKRWTSRFPPSFLHVSFSVSVLSCTIHLPLYEQEGNPIQQNSIQLTLSFHKSLITPASNMGDACLTFSLSFHCQRQLTKTFDCIRVDIDKGCE